MNVFYTRFDQRDLRIQQAQAMEKVRDKPAQPLVISEEEVRLNFRNINCRSASGSDKVSDEILKLCSDSLIPVFTQLLHRSFNTGHIPNIWKTCTIIPVPKKRSSSQLNDYRPVALTPVAFKCAEKIVLQHLRSETAGRQDPMQFAYCKDRNTGYAILTLLHKLYRHLDRPKTFARVLFLDFSSAFNTMQPPLSDRETAGDGGESDGDLEALQLSDRQAPAGQDR